MNREQIYSALFAKISGLSGIVTSSRRLKHWNDVNPSEQPAIFQTQSGETPKREGGLPVVWKCNVELYIYCHSGNDSDVTPATQLNWLLDAVEQALAPDIVTGYQTLGGLVFDCKIAGKIETDEGLLGPQSVAVIPIEITVAD